MELKKSYVYAYHVTSHELIKVGFGENPRVRMTSYCAAYGISADTSSLKSWDFPAAGIASVIEGAIHESLIECGFERCILAQGDQEAQELFHLGSHSYHDALQIVTEAIEKTTRALMGGMRGKERLTTTERESRRREEIRKEKTEEKQRADFLKKQAEAELRARMTAKANAGWDSEVQPWLNALDKGKLLMQQKTAFEGIKRLWTGRDSVDELRHRENYSEILKLIEETFHAARTARGWRLRLVLEFGYGVWPDGIDLQAPGGRHLPGDSLHYALEEESVTEVRLAIQAALGWGGSDALTLMKRDPQAFQELLNFAKTFPSPERQTGRTWTRYTTLGKYAKPY